MPGTSPGMTVVELVDGAQNYSMRVLVPACAGTTGGEWRRGKLFQRHCCYKRKAFAHASAAKQSIVRLSKKLDCFAALAMTTSMGIRLGQHTRPRSRGANASELCVGLS